MAKAHLTTDMGSKQRIFKNISFVQNTDQYFR